jgi:hypothetical protein
MNVVDQSQALAIKPQPTRAAWREEMLGQLLSSMRERQLNVEKESPQSEPAIPRVYGKGHYVDLYV